MPGDFNTIRNHLLFERIISRVQRMPEMDPKAAFATGLPGFLSSVYEDMGPWRGRESVNMELPGVAADARAVAPHEKARLGATDMIHVEAKPGFILAGFTQMLSPDDFRVGMTAAQATERAARPLVDFNQKTAKTAFDVAVQGAFSSGTSDFSDDFGWTATDFNGNTVTKSLVTDTANLVPDVLANSTQTALWPLANGGRTAVNHDHLLPTQGAAWTEALADTARDLILEHPNAGSVVAYAGSNAAADVTAAIKSGYGAIESRVPLVGAPSGGTAGGFAEAQPISRPIGGVTYVHVPNMPDDIVLYVASNQRPFYRSVGATADDGTRISGTGSWRDPLPEAETGVRNFGHRDYYNAGAKNPLGAVVAEYNA